MPIALILFGIYNGSPWKNIYRLRSESECVKCIENNLKNIQKLFPNEIIDLFLSTNSQGNEMDKSFQNKFNYKSSNFQEDLPIMCYNNYDNVHENDKWKMGDGYMSRCKKELKGIELCLNYSKENNISYDYFIITRVDLLLLKELVESNIKLDNINIISELETEGYVCDNFYLLPVKYLNDFYEIIKSFPEVHHKLKYILEDKFNVNYILNEKTLINDLSFYTLKRT